jgi:hypothetical protein
LRIDTVHQEDRDGIKGLYHINAVDQVTQRQVVGATPHISDACLLPVLETMLDQVPFRIRGFHSDNAASSSTTKFPVYWNKLLIDQTKSRPRHSGVVHRGDQCGRRPDAMPISAWQPPSAPDSVALCLFPAEYEKALKTLL